MNKLRSTTVLLGLSACAALALAVSLLAGSVALSPWEAWQALVSDETSLAHTLIVGLRLPRALTAFALGGLLGLAGVLMQVLLRNPLADPFIMGVSGGASVAALLAILLGLSGFAISVAATAGAFLATLLVFALAHGQGDWSATRLLLTGVVVAAGASAAISLLLALGDDTRLRGMLFWLMGDLSFSNGPGPLLALLAVAAGTMILGARHLNVLARGATQASLLGLPVASARICIFLLSSLLTAATVTTAGTIGFVGLITPHLSRLLLGSDHRRVIPAAVMLGGLLVMLADLLARTLVAPRQLPVGALTAMVGVPVFLVLMKRKQAAG